MQQDFSLTDEQIKAMDARSAQAAAAAEATRNANRPRDDAGRFVPLYEPPPARDDDQGREKRFLRECMTHRYIRWEPKGVPVDGATAEVRTCEGMLYLFLTKEAFDASF